MDTDTCQLAAGAYYRGDWLYHHFTSDSPECANLHLNHKEVLAQIFAAFRWVPLWANRHVIIHCDNVAAVHIINKGTTNNSVVESKPFYSFQTGKNYTIQSKLSRDSKNV